MPKYLIRHTLLAFLLLAGWIAGAQSNDMALEDLLSNLLQIEGDTLEQQRILSDIDEVLAAMPEDSAKVNLLNDIGLRLFRAFPDITLNYGQQAVALAEQVDFPKGRAYAQKNIGLGYFVKGDRSKILDAWEQALQAFQESGDKVGESNILNNIGGVHLQDGNFPLALDYQLQSLAAAEDIEDEDTKNFRRASALSNMGAIYAEMPDGQLRAINNLRSTQLLATQIDPDGPLGPQAITTVGYATMNLGYLYLKLFEEEDPNPAYIDSSMVYFAKALEAFERNPAGADVPFVLSNWGRAYAFRKEYDKALDLQREAYREASNIDNRFSMATALLRQGDTYRLMGSFNEAIDRYLQVEKIAEDYLATDSTASLQTLLYVYDGLAESYSSTGDYEKAYEYYVDYAATDKQIYNIEGNRRIATLQFQRDLDMRDNQIELLNTENELKEAQIERASIQRNFLIATAVFLIIIAIGIAYSYMFARKANKIITAERNRSDSILLNILPEETANELKEHGEVQAKRFDKVSVLFTDFRGFTTATQQLPPEEVVKSVDYYFRAFDEITSRHHLEKIKTIGDAYMCAGGLPIPNDTNAEDAVHAALEMVEFVKNIKANPPQGLIPFDIRIGIHTGPVVAGVVGTKKFQYDIWGSTVNTASVMESRSEPNRVNISSATYQEVKDKFQFEYRDEIQGKHGEKYKMYFVAEGATAEVMG